MIANFLLLGILTLFLILSYYDYTFNRLPNELVFLLTTLTCAFVAVGEIPINVPALLLWPALYYFLWLLGRKIGGGDVKLALSTGALASAAGVAGVLGAIAVANALSLCALGRGRTVIAHGPHMMIGALGVHISTLL